MQTKDTPEKISALPPPPAPPARDANPWPWPEQANAGTRRPDRFSAIRRVAGPTGPRRANHVLPRLGVAVGMAALVLVIALNKGLGGGGPEDWIGLMFPVLFLVLFIASRLRKAGRQSSGTERPHDAD